jgi:hypothetical protein
VPESDDERKGRTIQRAWWAAMSGEHASSEEVEAYLVTLGYEEAARWLADPRLRERLDVTCKDAREELFRNQPRG